MWPITLLASVLAVSGNFQITSPAFKEGEPIPAAYTCDSLDISPPLEWSEPPVGTKSFALITDDPDAPMGTWLHWLLYNVPLTTSMLPERMPADAKLHDKSLQGITDFKRPGYGGPCPPSGTHRYYFRLYALDTVLPLPGRVGRGDLEKAMKGHILGQAELMGTYRRKGR